MNPRMLIRSRHDQEHVARSRRRVGLVVRRDRPARRDPAEVGHRRDRGLEVLAADVVEVHVDRGVLLEQLADRAVVVVEGRVEPELAGHPGDLLGRAGRPHDLGGPEQPRHLAGRRADRPGGAGDEHGLALLDGSDAGEADVRRHPRHAEHAEVRRGRHPPDVDDPDLPGGQQGVLAPAGLVQHGRADRDLLVPGRQDLADGPALERRVETERRHVGPGVVHPAAHVGVHRQEGVAHQHLAGAGIGQLGLARCGSRRAWASRTGGRPGGSPAWESSCSRSCPTRPAGCRRSRRRRLGRAFRHP